MKLPDDFYCVAGGAAHAAGALRSECVQALMAGVAGQRLLEGVADSM